MLSASPVRTSASSIKDAPSPLRSNADAVAPDTPSQHRREEEAAAATKKELDRVSSTAATTEEADRCLICMNGFTRRQPAYKIPCSARCNDTFVHEKCVYEWKERQSGQGSCPLCRSPLTEMTYVPPDVLRSAAFHIFAVRKDFVSRPVPPEVGMVRLYLRVYKTVLTGAPYRFEIYLQAPTILKYPLGPLPKPLQPAPGDQLLLVARKRFASLRNTRATIELSLDRNGLDFERGSDNFLGHVQSGLSGLEHVGVPADGRGEICCVQYNQNRVGRGVGPRKMRVCFPAVQRDTLATTASNAREDSLAEEDFDEDFDNAQRNPYRIGVREVKQAKDSLINVLREADAGEASSNRELVIGRNKEPYWLDSIMAYSLDFHGRVTLPSNKNFILMIPPGSRPIDAPPIPGDTNDAQVCLQFGKVDESPRDCYTMDVAFPMSVLQAAMICLSACDRKLACA